MRTSSSPRTVRSSPRCPGWLIPREPRLQGLVDLVADTVADLESNGEDITGPLSERSYSGKLHLRVGQGPHHRQAIRAPEEHLNLNQYVVQRLSGASSTNLFGSFRGA